MITLNDNNITGEQSIFHLNIPVIFCTQRDFTPVVDVPFLDEDKFLRPLAEYRGQRYRDHLALPIRDNRELGEHPRLQLSIEVFDFNP